jgi:hypothetical protein
MSQFLFPAAASGAAVNPGGPPPPVFNADSEVLKVEAKQLSLFVGQAALMLCVCTAALCLVRPRNKSHDFYVSDEDEELSSGS